MANVPFPLGLEGTEGLPQTRRALHNCFNFNGMIIQRPGISLLGTNGRVARGGFKWNNNLYVVASTDLLRIDNLTTGAYTVIGTIAGTANIDSATGFNEVVIVVKGGNGYTLNTSEVLTQITDADYLPSDSVAHKDGRFIYIPTDGSPAFFSDVGAGGTIQTSSFFDAEDLPDKNKFVINFRNVLYIGGEDSFESFQAYADDTITPYRRMNARIDNGYIGGGLEYNNTFLFIGREKGQDVGIYQMAQGMAPKISNEYIDTILSEYTEAQLAEAVANRFKWRGYDIATFTIADDAFGFYGGNWFRLSTMNDGDNVTWRAGFIVEFAQKYYCFEADRFGVLAAANTDYGDPFERLIDFGFESEGRFSAQSLTYRLSQGYNDSIGSVTLSMSDDNVLYGPKFQNNTGAKGHYMTQLVWEYPGGLGYYDRFMGVRLSTAEDIDFSAQSMDMTTR